MQYARCVLLSALALARVSAAQQPQQPPNINGGLPAVSPDGRHIAYISYRGAATAELRLIDPDGTNDRLLASSSHGAPVWLPDGRIVFESPTGYQAIAVNGAPAAALSLPQGGRGYAPSPNGRSVVYSAGRPPAAVNLMVSGMDGSQPRALVSGSGMAFNGAFSPDGRRIAYAWIDSTRDMQMWMVNADGTGAQQLTRFSGADGRPQWPSWSPDGSTIAVQAGVYARGGGENTAHIWLINVNTGAAQKLAPHDRAYLDETPSFFPDGKRIAFQSDRTGRMEIWVMDVDGKNARQVTK